MNWQEFFFVLRAWGFKTESLSSPIYDVRNDRTCILGSFHRSRNFSAIWHHIRSYRSSLNFTLIKNDAHLFFTRPLWTEMEPLPNNAICYFIVRPSNRIMKLISFLSVERSWGIDSLHYESSLIKLSNWSFSVFLLLLFSPLSTLYCI